MRRHSRQILINFLMTTLCWTLSSCALSPHPHVVYEDGRTVVGLQADRQAGAGHSHPAKLTIEQAAKILLGLRVTKDRYAAHRLFAGEADSQAAFKGEEALALAPHVAKAFEAAKPDELVTFYRRISDASTGLAYTTGGLFKRGDYLYLVLANCRQEPADTMSRITPGYEIDPIDEPLLPLRRAGYTVSFVPSEAEVHPVEEQWRWNFPDPRKIVIVNLTLALRSLESDYQTH
jgi:hypothetical protein